MGSFKFAFFHSKFKENIFFKPSSTFERLPKMSFASLAVFLCFIQVSALYGMCVYLNCTFVRTDILYLFRASQSRCVIWGWRDGPVFKHTCSIWRALGFNYSQHLTAAGKFRMSGAGICRPPLTSACSSSICTRPHTERSQSINKSLKVMTMSHTHSIIILLSLHLTIHPLLLPFPC